jgi:iron(III) transport system permease protein
MRVTAGSHKGRPWQRLALGRWLALGGYALGALGPVLVLLVATIHALADAGQAQRLVEWLSLTLPLGRRLGLYLESIELALAVSAVATVLGWGSALFLWSGRRWARSHLVWLVVPLMALPPYVHALAWLSLSDVAVASWTLFPFAFRGRAAVLWVEVAAFAPLALGCAWLGLHSIDPELLEAGRVARSDLQTLLHVTLPLGAPALVAGAGIIFLLSLLDYSVPSLFDVPVYAMEIFSEFSASYSPERAFLLALPLLVLAAAVVAAILQPVRTLALRQVRRGAGKFSGAGEPGWHTSPPHWPAWATVAWALAATIVAFQALSPLVVMVWRGAEPRQLASALAGTGGVVGYSLSSAFLAALLGVPLAAAAAHALGNATPREPGYRRWRAGPGKQVRTLVVLAPLAIPASLVGIGFILLQQQALQATGLSRLLAIQTAGAAVAWAGAARFAPLAALLFWAQLQRRDPLLLEAARVFQPSWWRRQVQVTLPLVAPGLLAGAGLVFALTMGELGATLMVIPPGRSTLTMRIYSYLHYGATATVTGLCLALAAAVLAAGLLAVTAVSLWPSSSMGRGRAETAGRSAGGALARRGQP